MSDLRAMRFLDSIARRYGARPCDLVGETDPWARWCIDFWAHNIGVQTNDPRQRR